MVSKGDIFWNIAGRVFTRLDLQRALIAACGHRITAGYWEALKQPIPRIIEAVELVTELRSEGASSDWDELFYG